MLIEGIKHFREYIRGTTRISHASKMINETTEMVWACDEKRRRAHGGEVPMTHQEDTTKDEVERCLRKRHERRGCQRGGGDKQGDMEERINSHSDAPL